MPTDVKVPTTGNSGEDAVVLEWLVAVGDTIEEGDTVVVLETAKATVDVPAPASGTVLAISAAPGDDVAEHSTIAVIGAPGDAVPGSLESGDAVPGGATAENSTATAPVEPSAPPLAPAAPATAAPALAPAAARASRGHASPRAALLAERNGVDLSTITGTGPGGRILALDVLAAKKTPSAAPSPAPAAAAAPAPESPAAPQYTSVPVRGARKVTAQRMHAALAEMAQVTLTRYADAAPLMAYLGRLRAQAERLGLPRLTVNDLVLFATAKTMARHPEANATFSWDEIRQYSTVDLGVAVDTGRALLVPVIRDAASLGLIDLATATAAAVDRARSGAITPDEMTGGTFTVSNLGGAGVHWFTPVVNPPQVCILGVGRALPASPAGPDLMPLSLTFDHRAIDGAAAGAVLADIADAIENIDILAAL